ncbi:rhodanese-like domain-containing protein [Nonomuraea lactucae]|uniref:rhodanese-like domain-containing protein n=1 Tax=Nonomuraea lactucae TaxID=2249762 RepID=UPI000DE36FFC|nr:rhodanese-like domain-containing protein [Nonomuraea lactucae]
MLALLQAGTVQLMEALPVDAYAAEHISGARNVPGQLTAELAEQVAPDRAGYGDVRVYAGGKQDWAQAGMAFEGSRAGTITEATAAAGRPA